MELFKLFHDNKLAEYLQKTAVGDVDVNIRDDNNQYLLSYAVLQNKVDDVKQLIRHESKIDIVDSDGRSIMYNPIVYNYIEIVKLLIDANSNMIGANIVNLRDKWMQTPLYYAVIASNPAIVSLLITAGADPNMVDNDGYNILHVAVQRNKPQIIKLLLPITNINSRTASGESALHIACNFQQIDIVEALLQFKIDVNIQDYEHEYAALNYAVTLNNKKITELLINNNADINIQDILGNTPLHYAFKEKNYEIAEMLIAKDVNMNVYNIDSKIPIIILLENNGKLSEKAFEKLLNGSNLNFQDINGNTALHLLINWDQYEHILKTKKLNIILKNKQNISPADIVRKTNKFDKYIDLVVESYLYQLTQNSSIERYTPEDKLCQQPKKECPEIIKKKILKLVNSKQVSCNEKTYPASSIRTCVVVKMEQNLDYCTFTGTVLDILFGLLYLLTKHNSACGVLTTNFTNKRNGYFNFEIVWSFKKLQLNEQFAEGILKCKNKRGFTIIPLGIELSQGSHANYLILDNKRKQIERFEPYGARAPNVFDYDAEQLDTLLEQQFKQIDPEIEYIKPVDYAPKIGFQLFDVIEKNQTKVSDPGGFCAVWAIWYTDMRLTYYDIDREKLIGEMIKNIRKQNLSFKQLIRNYSAVIVKKRNEVFKQVGIDINDWVNEQYTDEQYKLLIKEISSLVQQVV